MNYLKVGRSELFPLQSVINECGDCCLLSSNKDGLIKEDDFVVIDRSRFRFFCFRQQRRNKRLKMPTNIIIVDKLNVKKIIIVSCLLRLLFANFCVIKR
jgi:hypothetical protein